MAEYLLDTHIFLWSLLEPAHLTPDVIGELENAGNELWLSPITLWETIVLCEKGRIRLDRPPKAWIKDVLGTVPFREAVLNHEIAMRSRDVQLPHQDPADRFIAASAIVYGLTLVTADRNLIDGATEYSVLPNR